MSTSPLLIAVVSCVLVFLTARSHCSASPLWVVASVRSNTPYYNLSVLDPTTGLLSSGIPFYLETAWSNAPSQAVYQSATGIVQVNHINGSRVAESQWLYFDTDEQRLAEVGGAVVEGPVAPGCAVRDDPNGLLWSVTFAQPVETNQSNSVKVYLWQFPDNAAVPPSLVWTITVPFTAKHWLIPLSCAFDEALNVLYFNLNGQTPQLHSVDLSQGRLLKSVNYPPAPLTCYALAYSKAQSALYTYLSDDSGLSSMGLQQVDPTTGHGETLIEPSQGLTVRRAMTSAYDQATDEWFLFDMQSLTYLLVSPATRQILYSGKVRSTYNTMWAATFASSGNRATSAQPALQQ